jgi:hypothetical protein
MRIARPASHFGGRDPRVFSTIQAIATAAPGYLDFARSH